MDERLNRPATPYHRRLSLERLEALLMIIGSNADDPVADALRVEIVRKRQLPIDKDPRDVANQSERLLTSI